MKRWNMTQKQSLKMQFVMSQTVAMQQADLMQMSDFDFHKLISDIEQDPLFNRFFRQEKMIRYHRYTGTDIHPSISNIENYPLSGDSSPDIEALIARQSDLFGIIRKLGEEKFKKYFLFPQEEYSLEDISTLCNITRSETEAVNLLVNEVSVLSTFYHPPDSGTQLQVYTCLASIEFNGYDFIINYLSPVYARGRYIIDYDNIEILMGGHTFDKDDVHKAKTLLRKLEFINNRKNILQNVLTSLIRKQSLFLKDGKKNNLLPFSQKELAREIDAEPSSVSRVIRMKSIITPWNEEIPLEILLPNPHYFKKELVKNLLKNEPGLRSDRAISCKIKERFGVHISRRSISALRKELHIKPKGIGMKGVG